MAEKKTKPEYQVVQIATETRQAIIYGDDECSVQDLLVKIAKDIEDIKEELVGK